MPCTSRGWGSWLLTSEGAGEVIFLMNWSSLPCAFLPHCAYVPSCFWLPQLPSSSHVSSAHAACSLLLSSPKRTSVCASQFHWKTLIDFFFGGGDGGRKKLRKQINLNWIKDILFSSCLFFFLLHLLLGKFLLFSADFQCCYPCSSGLPFFCLLSDIP